MSKPRVFVVQQPTGRDRVTQAIRNTMDLTPATEFGDLCFILKESDNPFKDINTITRRVHHYLLERQYGPQDFLLLVGNPVLIAVVAAVAATHLDKLQVLQWARSEGRYHPVAFQLPDLASA